MATHTTEHETRRSDRRGAGYYFLLFALLAFTGLYFGVAIPTFLGIIGAG
ncbi:MULTISPECIES: hypothetical protein [Phenylobacterium]|uniref:MFS transporter n=1 Tax=Phenylobacterium koreense TaxID=266125 RepID=A0ABV2EJS8_9CAUL